MSNLLQQAKAWLTATTTVPNWALVVGGVTLVVSLFGHC